MYLRKILWAALSLSLACNFVYARQRGETIPRVKSGTNSQIVAKSGSKLKNSSSRMNVGKTKITKRMGAAFEGLPVGFIDGGIALNDGASTTFTGSYNPTTGSVSVANSSYRASSGDTGTPVELSEGAAFEGIPNVSQSVSIASGATASVGCQSTVTSDFDLNNGTASLSNALSFGDGAQLIGDGSILGNGLSTNLGGRDLLITSSVRWVNADLVANSRLTLYGQWTFLNDIHVLGRGNLLDLTHGGRLIIKDNTTVYLANLNVKGLTPNSIIFEGANSKVVLSSSSLGFDTDFTLTLGQVYIDSQSIFVVGTKIVTFAVDANLTINRESLFYDTLKYPDQLNIRPLPADDPGEIYITYLNGGRIRSYNVVDVPLGDITISNPTFLMVLDLFLSADRRLIILNNCEIDGGGHFIHFAKDNAGVLDIAAGCTVVLKNVVLKNFSDLDILFGAGSNIIFGDGTSIELNTNQVVSWPWIFDGNTLISGRGNVINLDTQAIKIMQQGSLMMQDITIEGLTGNNLSCVGNASIEFSNDTLLCAPGALAYSFTCGSLVFDKDVKFKGVFEYSSDQTSTIGQNSRLSFEPLYPAYPFSAFLYAPVVANRNLIEMADYTSELYLNGCILASSTTGLRLTKGSLIADGKNYLLSFGAASLSEGICFGNGNSSDDLYIKVLPGASLEVDGILDIQNVN